MMEKQQQQQQEPLRESKTAVREPPKAGGVHSFARGANKWAAGVPLSELPEDELLEMASVLGNSAMGDLLGMGRSVETAFFSFNESGGLPQNKIVTAAPELTAPSGLGRAGADCPPQALVMRDRGAPPQSGNVFGGNAGAPDFGTAL